MRFTRTVALFLTLAVPCAAYAQKSKKSKPQSRTIEGTVIGSDGTRYVNSIVVESRGKTYSVVTGFNGVKGMAPTIIGGDVSSTGTRVRVIFIGDRATRIVKLDSRTVDTPPTQTDENGFQVFFIEFGSAVRKRDAATLKLMMSSTVDFTQYGDDKQSLALDYLARGNGEGWRDLEKSLTTGTKPYKDSSPQIVARVTNDNSLLFGRGSDGKWRWLRFLLA